MVHSLPTNAVRSSPGSWIDAWRQRRRRHPAAFTCGIRVVQGTVPGFGRRWRYRDSAVDVHASDDAVALHHGSDVTLRLRFPAPMEPVDVRTRPNHVVLSAIEVATDARVQVSVPLGELSSFGPDV